MPENIVILGGSGFIGHHLAKALALEEEFTPIFVIHRTRPEWFGGLPVEVRECSLADAEGLRQILSSATSVINLLRPDGTGERLRILKAIFPLLEGRSVIHASSIDVYGEASRRVLTETSQPRPTSPYAQEHLAIENMLLSGPISGTVIRLGAVFGDGGRNVASFANEAAYGYLPVLLARRLLYGQRRMHLVSVEAVIAAILSLLRLPTEHRPTRLLVTDDQDERNNFAFVQDRLLTAFGRSAFGYLPHLPYPCLEATLRMRGGCALNVRRRFVTEFGSLLAHGEPDFGASLTSYARRLAEACPSP